MMNIDTNKPYRCHFEHNGTIYDGIYYKECFVCNYFNSAFHNILYNEHEKIDIDPAFTLKMNGRIWCMPLDTAIDIVQTDYCHSIMPREERVPINTCELGALVIYTYNGKQISAYINKIQTQLDGITLYQLINCQDGHFIAWVTEDELEFDPYNRFFNWRKYNG